MATPDSAASALANLDCSAQLQGLSHAQLEHLVEYECDNRDFDAFFDSLPAVRDARAEEAKLVTSCAMLARASVERASSSATTVSRAREAQEHATQAADELDRVLAAQREAYKAVASGEAVERRLAEAATEARTRGQGIKARIESTSSSSALEIDIEAYVDAARERHRAELMLLALRNQRNAGGGTSH